MIDVGTVLRRITLVGDCIEFTGARNEKPFDYGVIGRRIDGKTRTFKAHRVVYEYLHGPIPDGMVVMHTCDNPPCVRPDHLRLGTQGDNLRDMIAKGRRVTAQEKRTHCPRGHEYTEQNTYVHNNSRQCRTCKAQRNHRSNP